MQVIQVRCTGDSAESMHLLQDILSDRETLSTNYNYIVKNYLPKRGETLSRLKKIKQQNKTIIS